MKTKWIAGPDTDSCWLECHCDSIDVPDATPLLSFPFTIGRVETVELQIDSSRVSREHAVIQRQGDGCRLRDLGSTNGTFVNGRRISDVLLEDGDELTLGDASFIFHAGRRRGFSEETVLLDSEASLGRAPCHSDLVYELRRMHELLLHGAIRTRLYPIIEIDGNAVYGYSSVPSTECEKLEGTGKQYTGWHSSSRFVRHFWQLHRLHATERLQAHDEPCFLFVGMHPAELDGTDRLQAQLSYICDNVPACVSLVLELPATAHLDERQTGHLRGLSEELSFGLAYSGFVGSHSRLSEYGEMPPAYITLATTMLRDVHRNKRQQQQLRTLRDACQSIGCQPILERGTAQEDLLLCDKLGYRLAVCDEHRTE